MTFTKPAIPPRILLGLYSSYKEIKDFNGHTAILGNRPQRAPCKNKITTCRTNTTDAQYVFLAKAASLERLESYDGMMR